MAKKKEEGVEETVETAETPAADETATEKKPKRAAKKADAADAEPSVIDTVIDTVASAAETVGGSVAEAIESGAAAIVNAVTGSDDGEKKAIVHKRAEKIGVVASDKMTKTVTVRVDRLVKHPIYRKYVRRRKKFMAHDEMGAKVGDKVRIIETRPMSARKRWRVVEIIQKAEL